jgi:hypothetical protein
MRCVQRTRGIDLLVVDRCRIWARPDYRVSTRSAPRPVSELASSPWRATNEHFRNRFPSGRSSRTLPRRDFRSRIGRMGETRRLRARSAGSARVVAPPVTDNELWCRHCGTITPHQLVEIPAFIASSEGGPDPGRLDWHCRDCGDIYEHPSEHLAFDDWAASRARVLSVRRGSNAGRRPAL